MNNKLTQKEMDNYVKSVPAFIEDAEGFISNTILKSEKDVIEQSMTALSPDFRESKKLLIATLSFILKCKSGVPGKDDENTSEVLTLLVNYFQSIHHTENLLLRGQYIAVAALMKKDFETMVKLLEIKAGKAKYGKTPNTNYAPKEMKFIYRQLNDVAHISKSHVIGFYLEKESESSGKGVSPSPQFKEEQFKAFFSYHVSIMQTIVAEAISRYKIMYGVDENYKDMMSYFIVACDVLDKFGEKYLAEKKPQEAVKPVIE